MTTKAYCPNIYDDDRTYSSIGFGLARAKQEGAPVHPDEFDWEHPPGSGCEKCQKRYERQLKAFNDYNRS